MLAGPFLTSGNAWEVNASWLWLKLLPLTSRSPCVGASIITLLSTWLPHVVTWRSACLLNPLDSDARWSRGSPRIGDAQWIWPSSCLRVEVGAVSTLVMVMCIESCLQRQMAMSVVGAGAGAMGELEGGTGLAAIARMACGGTSKPVEKFRWVWFSLFLMMGHWICIVLFPSSFVWTFKLYSPTDQLAKGPHFHKNMGWFHSPIMVASPTRAYIGGN